MSYYLRLLILVASIVTLFYVLRKIRKSQLQIEDSLFWIFLSLIFNETTPESNLPTTNPTKKSDNQFAAKSSATFILKTSIEVNQMYAVCSKAQ